MNKKCNVMLDFMKLMNIRILFNITHFKSSIIFSEDSNFWSGWLAM